MIGAAVVAGALVCLAAIGVVVAVGVAGKSDAWRGDLR